MGVEEEGGEGESDDGRRTWGTKGSCPSGSSTLELIHDAGLLFSGEGGRSDLVDNIGPCASGRLEGQVVTQHHDC